MEKRWYDNDPVIKLAVTMIEKSDDEIKDYITGYIIDEAKNMGAVTNLDSFECFWQRWQDKNLKYFEAMEYFKIIDFETQKQLSVKIIDYIESFNKKKD